MTALFFVRHALPDLGWKDGRTRPLTEEGLADREKVCQIFRSIKPDVFVSSPYKRSYDTIEPAAKEHGMSIHEDERLHERISGPGGWGYENLKKRWADFDHHEQEGESLAQVQERNMAAVMDMLHEHEGKKVVVGTHGTALSTILNNYDPTFDCDDFTRLIDFMPYVIRLDFDGDKYLGKEELLMLDKDLYRESMMNNK